MQQGMEQPIAMCLLWKFILHWWWMHSWTVSLHLCLWVPPSHPFLYHNGCWYNRAVYYYYYTGYTGRLSSCVCEGPLTSHSTLILQWRRGIRLVSSLICLEGCLWLLWSLSSAPRWDHSASLRKVSLALINIHTCSGRLNFPPSRGGGWVVRALLPSCLTEEGNLRVILWPADSALNLDGHGLIRLTLTNLKQMGGFSKVSSDTGRRMVVAKWGGDLEQKLQDANSWLEASVRVALAFEPHQSSEETGPEERCLYSHRITFQMAPLPKLNKYTAGFLCSKKRKPSNCTCTGKQIWFFNPVFWSSCSRRILNMYRGQ